MIPKGDYCNLFRKEKKLIYAIVIAQNYELKRIKKKK